jgi:hypothetical protein
VVSAVYAVFDQAGVLWYVGGSVNLHQRWRLIDHWQRFWGRPGLAITWLVIDDADSRAGIEAALIFLLAPRLNVIHKSDETPVFELPFGPDVFEHLDAIRRRWGLSEPLVRVAQMQVLTWLARRSFAHGAVPTMQARRQPVKENASARLQTATSRCPGPTRLPRSATRNVPRSSIQTMVSIGRS